MALKARRDADVLARLLQGDAVPDAPESVRELSVLAGALPRPAVSPDPAFVVRLRSELVKQADARRARLTLERTAPTAPTARVTPVGSASTHRARDGRGGGQRELVLRLPRGIWPGLAAGALGLAVLVGGLSSRALPGDRLYDVKLGIGQAQVRLAGSDLARGRALLGQVDHRIDEVGTLVAAGDPRSWQVDLALRQAADDLADAQRVLLAGDADADPEALQALADASAQARGRLTALAPLMPTASGLELRRLLALLQAGDQVARRQALACGSPCAAVRRALDQALPGAPSGSGASGGALPAAGGDPAASGVRTPGAVPSTATTQVPSGGGRLPGAPPVQQPSTSLPGGTVSVPGVGVTVPGVTVTTVPGGQPTLTVPPLGVTLGSLTATASTSGCLVDLLGLCVGG